MRKLPKTRDYRSMLGTGIKVVVVAEGLFLVGSYALWRSMNTSRGEAAHHWFSSAVLLNCVITSIPVPTNCNVILT